MTMSVHPCARVLWAGETGAICARTRRRRDNLGKMFKFGADAGQRSINQHTPERA
jgi:hypothetical protein